MSTATAITRRAALGFVDGSRVERIRIGSRIGGAPYRVRTRLTEGGMGELFEVEHEGLQRRCILKALAPRHHTRADFAERLRREAQILASLGAPATPTVYDIGELSDGRPFFVMQKLEGCDLRTELCRLGVLSVPSAVRLGAQLLHALSLVHSRGIVHRDIKLENLFLPIDGELALLDFGVARREHGPWDRTGKGHALGTPRSMAPEQHTASDTDARTDLYAAGLVLYELLAGVGPFDHVPRTIDALAAAHRHHVPPPPSARAPQPIPHAIERVILRALAKDPDQRFACAFEMAKALDEASATRFTFDEDPTEIDSSCVFSGGA